MTADMMSELIVHAVKIIDDVTENAIQPPEWQLEKATMEIAAEQIVRLVLNEMYKGTEKTNPSWSAREYIDLFARDTGVDFRKDAK